MNKYRIEAGNTCANIQVEQISDLIMINVNINGNENKVVSADNVHYIKDNILQKIQPYVNMKKPVVIFQKSHFKDNGRTVDQTANIMIVKKDKTVMDLVLLPDETQAFPEHIPDMSAKNMKKYLKKKHIEL